MNGLSTVNGETEGLGGALGTVVQHCSAVRRRNEISRVDEGGAGETTPPMTRGREDERRSSALGAITRSRAAALRVNGLLAVNGEETSLRKGSGLERKGRREEWL